MKIAYFDCFSGVSGDMCLGALISAGLDFSLLKQELTKLSLTGYDLRWERVTRNGISAADVHVEVQEANQPARRIADILHIIEDSMLPEGVKEQSKAVFNRLAAAEAKVHDLPVEEIHFHEVGAVDAIVDVVGTVLGLHLLAVDKVYASPLPMGKGFIKCMHGLIPSPAPAVLEVLQDVPIYGTDMEEELVTPTGAALLAVLADAFVNLPALNLQRIGYGSGKKVMEHPNLLRIILGEACITKGLKSAKINIQGHSGHKHRHGHSHKSENDHHK